MLVPLVSMLPTAAPRREDRKAIRPEFMTHFQMRLFQSFR
uniref:Uncharacterized protein n=1 Tax=Arundo donax TaxID=35708 RepID=A0A0A9CFD1_ARUDO